MWCVVRESQDASVLYVDAHEPCQGNTTRRRSQTPGCNVDVSHMHANTPITVFMQWLRPQCAPASEKISQFTRPRVAHRGQCCIAASSARHFQATERERRLQVSSHGCLQKEQQSRTCTSASIQIESKCLSTKFSREKKGEEG